jgi:uncharacterized membrane protein
MAFCAQCGSQVDGKFCPKCGAPADAGAAAGGATNLPPAANPGLGMDENLAAALCYIPIVGLIFLLVEPYSKNKAIRFHALQSVFFCVAWIIVAIVLGIFGGILFAAMPSPIWSLWMAIVRLVELAFFIGLIIMAVKAFQGQRFVMPIVGPMAEKQA